MPQDEKFAIIDMARSQYRDLMDILNTESPEDPYSLLPSELEKALRQYERSGAVVSSMNFTDALERYWGEIKVSPVLNPYIKKIATRPVFDIGLYIKRSPGNTGSYNYIENVYRLIKEGKYSND